MTQLLPSLLALLSVAGAVFGSPEFINGRPKGGFVPLPPDHERRALAASLDAYVSTSYFTQKQDHFDRSNTNTWSQRYVQGSRHYRSGGPMFVYIGGESAISPGWINYGLWDKSAQEHGAMMFMLEHRYYGQSQPVRSLTKENMRFLSSRQALEDLSYFIQSMQRQHSLQGAKVIVFGGSYPGNLAAWFRLHYPQVCHGAVASSAPVQAELDFVEYLEVVGQAMDELSPGCSALVRQAYQEVSNMVTRNDIYTLQQYFSAAASLNVQDKTSVQSFFLSIVIPWESAAQYNSNYHTLEKMCKKMKDTYSGTVVQRLSSALRGQRLSLSMDIERNIAELNQTSWDAPSVQDGGRQWLYQTCTEFGYDVTTDSNNQPFGHHFPLSCIEQFYCQQSFSISPSTTSAAVQRTNQRNYGKNIGTTNLVMPNGSIDPWRSLSVIRSSYPGVVPIYIPGASHCHDMGGDQPGDSAQLKAARQKILREITKMLQS